MIYHQTKTEKTFQPLEGSQILLISQMEWKTQTTVSSLQYFCLSELTLENDWGGGETGGQAVWASRRMER